MRLLVLGDFSGKTAGRPGAARDPDRPTGWISTTLDDVDAPAGTAADRGRPARSGSNRSTTFIPTGCTPGSTCSRAYARRAPTHRPANDDVPRPSVGQTDRAWSVAATTATTGLDALIRNIVKPHIVPDISAQRCAASGGSGCGDRRANAQAAARAGVPVARSGLARRPVVELESGARREPSTAPVRRVARRAARRHRCGAGPGDAVRPPSRVGRPLARRRGCPRLVGADWPVYVRPLGHRCRTAGRAWPDRVARRRPAPG